MLSARILTTLSLKGKFANTVRLLHGLGCKFFETRLDQKLRKRKALSEPSVEMPQNKLFFAFPQPLWNAKNVEILSLNSYNVVRLGEGLFRS